MNRLNNLFNIAGNDGMKHIILSAILTVVAKYLLPVFGSILDTYNKNKEILRQEVSPVMSERMLYVILLI